MVKLDIEIRITEELCPVCYGPMISIGFLEDDWFSLVAGTLPRCFDCQEIE